MVACNHSDITKDSNRDYQEKRYNPAIALSIIQSSFGYALYDGNDTVGVTYLSEAVEKYMNIYKKVRKEEAHELLDLNPTQQKCKKYQLNSNYIQG